MFLSVFHVVLKQHLDTRSYFSELEKNTFSFKGSNKKMHVSNNKVASSVFAVLSFSADTNHDELDK